MGPVEREEALTVRAKLNHIAIVSENYALSARFYESLFGMRTAHASPRRALTVGDGVVLSASVAGA